MLNKFETKKKATAPIKMPTEREPTTKLVADKAKTLVIIEPTAAVIKQESFNMAH